MKLQNYKQKRKARIEIVPLIDIIFFLMATFVMVSMSMIKNTAVPVNLPSAKTAAPQERDDSLTLSVTKDGEIFFEKERTNQQDLKTQLSVWKARQKDPKVFIHSDQEAPFKHIMEVMDAVRLAGVKKVAMQTRPDASASGADAE